MAYTARTLIINSYYLSGIVPRGFATPTGEQTADGLDLLNGLLAIKTANQRLIPYYEEYVLTPVVGQELYFIANLIGIETVTYNLQTVRFPMVKMGRNDYFGQMRADDINSLPFTWHVERTVGGANLYVYFKPVAEVLPIKIWGKFSLASVDSLDEDLSEYLDMFYIEYLRHALAEYICCEYNQTFNPQSQQKLNEIESQIMNISPPDLSMRKVSMLEYKGYGFNWATVNLNKGFMPT